MTTTTYHPPYNGLSAFPTPRWATDNTCCLSNLSSSQTPPQSPLNSTTSNGHQEKEQSIRAALQAFLELKDQHHVELCFSSVAELEMIKNLINETVPRTARITILEDVVIIKMPTLCHSATIGAIHEQLSQWDSDIYTLFGARLFSSERNYRNLLTETEPDLLIYPSTRSLECLEYPSVILEVSYTTSLSTERRKAINYLTFFHEPPVCVVVILDFHLENREIAAVYLEHWECYDSQDVTSQYPHNINLQVGKSEKTVYQGDVPLCIETWGHDSAPLNGSKTHAHATLVKNEVAEDSESRECYWIVRVAMTKRKQVNGILLGFQ